MNVWLILAHLPMLYFVILHTAQNFMLALTAVLFVSIILCALFIKHETGETPWCATSYLSHAVF